MKIFEKYPGKYVYDTGDREEFLKADNTCQKDDKENEELQFIKSYHRVKRQTTNERRELPFK